MADFGGPINLPAEYQRPPQQEETPFDRQMRELNNRFQNVNEGRYAVPGLDNTYYQYGPEGRYQEGRTIYDEAGNPVVGGALGSARASIGAANRPAWESLLDRNQGRLQSQFQLGTPQAMRSGPGLEALAREATKTGPSVWSQLAMQRNQADRAAGLSNVTAQAQQAQAQARSALASRMGLGQGTAARLASQSMRDALAAKQGVNKQANLANLELQMKDQQTRASLLPQFAQMEADQQRFNIGQSTQAKQFDIAAALSENQAKRQADLDAYKAQLGQYGAEKQAQAIGNSGTRQRSFFEMLTNPFGS